MNSPRNSQWREASMFSLICVCINGWVSNHEAGDLRRHSGHYGVIVKRWCVWLQDSMKMNDKTVSLDNSKIQESGIYYVCWQYQRWRAGKGNNLLFRIERFVMIWINRIEPLMNTPSTQNLFNYDEACRVYHLYHFIFHVYLLENSS